MKSWLTEHKVIHIIHTFHKMIFLGFSYSLLQMAVLYFSSNELMGDNSEMGKLKLNTTNLNNETSVPNVFLDEYMKDANGEFVKVYLYILRCSYDVSKSISLTDIADRLNLTEKDITRALKYWASHKVMDVEFDEASGEPIALTMLDLTPSSNNTATTAAKKSPARKSPAVVKPGEAMDREEIQQLFYVVEQYIKKTLSSSDMQIIFRLRDELHFTTDLIEYLVEYCVSNGHTSLRYMETVAISWSEQGITTIDMARNSTTMYSRRINPVLKAFGISGRTLSPVETDFINRWYDEYGFDFDIVKEACNRTILSIGKPSFSYADSILKKWKAAGVHTLDEAKALDGAHKYSVSVPVGTKPTKAAQFNNISSRNYNFDEMEKALIGNNN